MQIQLVRVLAVLFIFFGINTVLAEGPIEEDWTGSITMPGQKKENVKFEITQSIDTVNKNKHPIKIEIIFDGDFSFDFENITTINDSNKLSFSLNTGSLYDCILDWHDDGPCYIEGVDKEDVTRKISLTMIPPKDKEETPKDKEETSKDKEETPKDNKETDEIK